MEDGEDELAMQWYGLDAAMSEDVHPPLSPLRKDIYTQFMSQSLARRDACIQIEYTTQHLLSQLQKCDGGRDSVELPFCLSGQKIRN